MTSNTALVTGGTSGLGKAITERLIQAQYKVIFTGRDSEKGQHLSHDLNQQYGPLTRFVPVDLSDKQQIQHLFEVIRSTYGHLDVACNNAGTDDGALGTPVANILEEDFDRQIRVNLKGAWLCMKAEIQMMRSQKQGSIINIASVNGLGGTVGAGAYAAAKHGLIGLSKTAALEYAAEGIQVNVICPGFFETPMLERVWQQVNPEDSKAVRSQMENLVPLNRIGKPEEIAETVLWLASPRMRYLTGHSLIIDGGLTAQFR